MDQVRVDAQGVASGFGVPDEGSLPMRRDVGVIERTQAARARPWISRVLDLARNVAIAVALMTILPVTVVSNNGDKLWRRSYWAGNAQSKMLIAEVNRPLELPKDPSITPMEAGLAFAALEPPRNLPTPYRMRTPKLRAHRVWQQATLTPDMFRTARPFISGGPLAQEVIEATAAGFTPAEKAYLHEVGTAPLWREFDRVARAPAVDMVGGRFELPLTGDAGWESMPVPNYKAIKELAYASSTRAAWFLANGQRDSAEAALRAVISFGFAMADNGSTLMDELMGAVVIGVGRDALQHFYTVTHDPRSVPAQPTREQIAAARIVAFPRDLEAARKALMARVNDPHVTRAERYETLRMLAFSTCTNGREFLFGRRDDVRSAMDKARADLARFPSERALGEKLATVPGVRGGVTLGDPIAQFVAGAAIVPSLVLNRPDMPTCAAVAGMGYLGP
jgi:hypothetical protein